MFSVVFLLKGVVAPAVAAFVAVLLLKRISNGSRGIGAAAYAVGQMLGTVLMIYGTDDWLPSRNLQWVPWVGFVAAVLGPTVVATGLASIERWSLTIFAAAAVALVLVPHWPDLWPPRPISVALFTLLASIVCRLIEGLARHTPPQLIAVAMAAVALLAALLIAAAFSLSIGEAALTTASALVGTAVATSFRQDAMAVRGLCLPFTLAVGGWCYVTAIEPSPPIVALLFLPATPLVLWATAIGPLSRWTARWRVIASVLLLTLTLAGISAWTWFSTVHGSEQDSLSMTGADTMASDGPRLHRPTVDGSIRCVPVRPS